MLRPQQSFEEGITFAHLTDEKLRFRRNKGPRAIPWTRWVRFALSNGNVTLQHLQPPWRRDMKPFTHWCRGGTEELWGPSEMITHVTIITEGYAWCHKCYSEILLSFESFNIFIFPAVPKHLAICEWDNYAFFRSKHLFAFHAFHKNLLASTLVPFGDSEGGSILCLSPGFWGLMAILGMLLVPWPVSAQLSLCLCLSMAFSPASLCLKSPSVPSLLRTSDIGRGAHPKSRMIPSWYP